VCVLTTQFADGLRAPTRQSNSSWPFPIWHAARRKSDYSGHLAADKPLFGAVADELLAFVGDAPLVAHNAGFDIAFLNAELKRASKPPIATERVVDTLVLARRKHADGHNTLDDLCSRYGINSLRRKHGALLDAELLAAG
jgi:DNA polymerase III subunit epsilon